MRAKTLRRKWRAAMGDGHSTLNARLSTKRGLLSTDTNQLDACFRFSITPPAMTKLSPLFSALEFLAQRPKRTFQGSLMSEPREFS